MQVVVFLFLTKLGENGHKPCLYWLIDWCFIIMYSRNAINVQKSFSPMTLSTTAVRVVKVSVMPALPKPDQFQRGAGASHQSGSVMHVSKTGEFRQVLLAWPEPLPDSFVECWIIYVDVFCFFFVVQSCWMLPWKTKEEHC